MATRSYNQYDGYGSSGEVEIQYSRDRPEAKRSDSEKKKSPPRTNTQQHTPPASPQRRNTRKYVDEEGNDVEEAEDGASLRPRAHGWVSSDDEDAKTTTKKSSVQNSRINGGRASPTSRYKNADGDDEVVWEGSHAPGIRTHDYSDEKAINEKLFGKNAPKPPSRSSSSNDKSQADHVQEHSGDELPPVRTHDYSDQDAINEKLFGKGAKNADSHSPPSRRGTSRQEKDKVEEHSGDELPAVRTHDYSDQDAINEKLFGKGAKNADSPRGPSRRGTGRDHVEEHSGDELPAVRTHDYSDQNAINEKLFGKGAKNA